MIPTSGYLEPQGLAVFQEKRPQTLHPQISDPEDLGRPLRRLELGRSFDILLTLGAFRRTPFRLTAKTMILVGAYHQAYQEIDMYNIYIYILIISIITMVIIIIIIIIIAVMTFYE